jgi:chaperonin GroES
MNVTPLYDRVLIRPVEEDCQTAGGLLVPDIARKNSPLAYGDVVCAGAGRINLEGTIHPLIVKTGDVVLYLRKQAQPVDVPGGPGEPSEVLGLLREPDILAIVSGLPRDTGMLDADGRRLLSMDPARMPQTSDAELESDEVDAKLKEEGWDDGIGITPKDEAQAVDIREV